MFFLLARVTADRGAQGLVREDWVPLVSQAMFAFLLLVGYAGFGFVLEGQHQPVSSQGLSPRAGWPGEAGMGIAFGWAIAVACVLPMVVFGGLSLHFSFSVTAFGWLAADIAYFALAT